MRESPRSRAAEPLLHDFDGVLPLAVLPAMALLHVTDMQGAIFDRWGNMVFSSQDIPFVWDGLFNDKEVMPGVYVVVLHCQQL